MLMEKPAIRKDFIDELSTYKTDKDTLIHNEKVCFNCDVCKKEAYGSHLWVRDDKHHENEERLPGYDWLKFPDGWLVLWTVNGPIYVCSKICAIKLNTDLFYDED